MGLETRVRRLESLMGPRLPPELEHVTIGAAAFLVLMRQMGAAVQAEVADEETRERIGRRWRSLRLTP